MQCEEQTKHNMARVATITKRRTDRTDEDMCCDARTSFPSCDRFVPLTFLFFPARSTIMTRLLGFRFILLSVLLLMAVCLRSDSLFSVVSIALASLLLIHVKFHRYVAYISVIYAYLVSFMIFKMWTCDVPPIQ